MYSSYLAPVRPAIYDSIGQRPSLGEGRNGPIELVRDFVREYPLVPDYCVDLCESLSRPIRPFGPGSTRFWLGEMYRELAGVPRRGGEIILAALAVREADEFGPDRGGPFSRFGPRLGSKKP